MKRLLAIIISFISIVQLWGYNYTAQECQGSLSPYPTPTRSYDYPDSLKPVFINHLGRHGSRYPAGSTSAYLMRSYLTQADSTGAITPLGRKFLNVVNEVISLSNGRWGALDSLGMAEQRGIAHRMYANFPQLLSKGNITAIATYSPRVVQSMYSFTHQLSELSNNINISANDGRKYSPLLRFFDTDTAYVRYLQKGAWKGVYADYLKANCNTAAVKRLFTKKFNLSNDEWCDLAMTEYYLIAGMQAMELPMDYKPYITVNELNQLWSIFNLRQYLQRTASVVSNTPITSAIPLLLDIINSADSVLKDKLNIQAKLRFAHAETLMPLLSLIAIPGCYYLTNYYDTVANNWKDFYVTPMATNLQLIYFKAPSGTIYVRGDLNEVPIKLIRGNENTYVPLDELRSYWLNLTYNVISL